MASEPCVSGEVEGMDTVRAVGPLEDLRMAERPGGVVETGDPMVLHAPCRKFEVLGLALILLRPIDELDDVIDLAAGFWIEQRELRGRFQLIRQLREQVGQCVAESLLLPELVRARPRPAGILDLLMPGRDLPKGARNRTAGTPYVDLEGERLPPVGAFEDPLQRSVGDQSAVPI